jgi:hypothetical protein
VDVAPFGAFLRWRPLASVAVPSLPPGARPRILTATFAGDAALPAPPDRTSLGLPFNPLWGWRKAVALSDAHFVGNLNVYVSRTAPVERHVERAIGLQPGRDNLALFCVGDGRPDRYTFSIGSAEPGWGLDVLGATWGTPVTIRSAVIPLRIRPAPRAESGGVSLLVERESTGQVVPIEFELDVAACSKCFFF